MARLKHALLARSVSVTERFEITSILDIVYGDTVTVTEFPTRFVMLLVFWAAAEPGELFQWRFGVNGPEGSSFHLPPVNCRVNATGEAAGTSQVPVDVPRAGLYRISLSFSEVTVWTRSFSVLAEQQSQTIQ